MGVTFSIVALGLNEVASAVKPRRHGTGIEPGARS